MMDEENFFKALEKGEIEQAGRILDGMKPGLTRTRTLYLEGMLLEASYELEEALKKFNMALVLHLSDPSIWLAKANVLKELGKLEMARRAVDRACRLSSGNPAAHLLYGDILYRMKDYTGASRQIDIALDLAPGDAEVLTLKGILVSILDQDYREALKYFDSALGSDDGYNKAWTNRGIALRQIGDQDGALYSFQKALILDEGDKVAKKMLEKMGAGRFIVGSGRKEKRMSLKTHRYFAESSSSGARREKRPRKSHISDDDEDETGNREELEEEDMTEEGWEEVEEEEEVGEEG
ncbi:MAG: tetratricopeptide repeat protein, partial [Candidatus Thermoplasmatota archaeon]|nr:tetratricopeptide repeat protein [Candidatus Thermoplasmatota archaeon]